MSGTDPRTAVTGYLDHLAVERGASRNTVSAYRRDLDRYLRHLRASGVDDLDAVTEAHVEAFRAELATGTPGDRNVGSVVAGERALAPGSVARTVSAVRGLHAFALREGMATADVAAAVRPPRVPRRLPKALPVADVVAVIEAAGAVDDPEPTRLRDRALLELLYATGARAAELVGLDVDDVTGAGTPGSADAAAGEADQTVLLRGKGGKERLVPVGRPAREAVAAYLVRARPVLSAGRTPALFLNSRGDRMSRQSLWEVVRRAATAAGVSGEVSPHSFRHSFATHLLDGGADLRVVQELLGHSSVTTTQLYTLVTVETLREVWTECHPRAR